MTSKDDASDLSADKTASQDKTPGEKLAELVARRKAAAANANGGGLPGQRRTERAAAALSASKSKPAPRRG